MDLKTLLFNNKQVCASFEATYKENWQTVLGLEISYFDKSKLNASNIKGKGLAEMFIALGMSEGATLNPIIEEFYTVYQRGKWDLIPSRYMYTNLLLAKPDVMYARCFVVRECDFFKTLSYDPRDGEPSTGVLTNDTQFAYSPSTDKDRQKSKMLYTVLQIKYTNGLEFVDIKPATFYEARREKSQSKAIHKNWEDEMAEKTHLKHYVKKYAGIKEQLLRFSSVLSGDLLHTDQEEKEESTPALTLEDVKKENAVKKIVDTFDAEVIEPSEFETIYNTLEGWTESKERFDEYYETKVKEEWSTFSTEEKEKIKTLLIKVKNSFDAVTLDDIE